ncbi:class I SAM-dependent methyltransferase [Paenibacillus albidus]|uniref:class I SAM-dependent methyltransferase n=1 Tax=Paenibacillus albidus TaxID=2041023 RepID=UPI001BE60223|nr:class I SAM-dependent methyltransferase [Paenibacillus albidus]MBT2288192.1 class I SAM-dependent methyltransferase [Paenibacillus albidus]
MNDYGAELFQGTAWYYSKYRLLYPASLIRYIIDKFSLNGEGCMLDLGCGSGQLALRFQDWFEQIVGVDTEPEMLAEANRLSMENRVDHVRWLYGKAEDLAGEWGFLRLTIIAKAFHWMDREAVLEILYNTTIPKGGIAIVDNDQKQEPLTWQLKVDEVVQRWLGKERRAGSSVYVPPTERHEVLVAKSKFINVERHVLPSYVHRWSVETIIGNLYSTSYAARRFFGDQNERFEDELRTALLSLDSEGVFTEEIPVSIITAFK